MALNTKERMILLEIARMIGRSSYADKYFDIQNEQLPAQADSLTAIEGWFLTIDEEPE